MKGTLKAAVFLTLSLCALLSIQTVAHVGATRRVGNVNVNVTIAGKNEGQAQAEEVFTLFVGEYSIHALLSNMEQNWAPIDDAKIEVAFNFDGETRSTATLEPVGKGEYVSLGTFDRPGEWTTQVTLTLKGQAFPLVLELPWEVLPGKASNQSTMWVILSVAIVAPLLLIAVVLFFYLTKKKMAKSAK